MLSTPLTSQKKHFYVILVGRVLPLKVGHTNPPSNVSTQTITDTGPTISVPMVADGL